MNELERKIEQLEKYIEVKEQECNELQDRIDRAIEYINKWLDGEINEDIIISMNNLGNILKGE